MGASSLISNILAKMTMKASKSIFHSCILEIAISIRIPLLLIPLDDILIYAGAKDVLQYSYTYASVMITGTFSLSFNNLSLPFKS